MVQRVVWTKSAYKDLQNIVEYISKDSAYYAMSFYDDLMILTETLINFPQRGRVVPEMSDDNMREIYA